MYFLTYPLAKNDWLCHSRYLWNRDIQLGFISFSPALFRDVFLMFSSFIHSRNTRVFYFVNATLSANSLAYNVALTTRNEREKNEERPQPIHRRPASGDRILHQNPPRVLELQVHVWACPCRI